MATVRVKVPAASNQYGNSFAEGTDYGWVAECICSGLQSRPCWLKSSPSLQLLLQLSFASGKTDMTFRTVVSLIIIFLSLNARDLSAAHTDYTSRSYLEFTCEIFARDASLAAYRFNKGEELNEVLELVNDMPAETGGERLFQAIQFVWKHQINNPTLAYTLAMGLCMKPKNTMAPIDEPWVISPRTISNNL